LTFSAIVLNGIDPLSHAATLTACPSSGLHSSETIVIQFLYGSRGLRMGVNSKSAPTFDGVQKPGLSPSGTNTTPNRINGLAAVFPIGVNAGTMASRNGNAIVAPIPRNTARRDMCFFIVNIAQAPYGGRVWP